MVFCFWLRYIIEVKLIMAISCDKRPYGRNHPMSQKYRAKCGRPYAMQHAVDAHDRRFHSGGSDKK